MSAQPALTLDRVETWLSRHGIAAGPEEDGAVFMGFPGCDIGVYLHDEEAALVVAGMWRGRPEAERLDEMRAFIDAQHRSTYGPDLAVTPAHDPRLLLLSTQMVAYVGAGMSEAQLDAFMDMGLGMTRAFFYAVEERFPELVTWEED
nr:YbjN domain-containing protein [uncultured Actinomyces sp.]